MSENLHRCTPEKSLLEEFLEADWTQPVFLGEGISNVPARRLVNDNCFHGDRFDQRRYRPCDFVALFGMSENFWMNLQHAMIWKSRKIIWMAVEREGAGVRGHSCRIGIIREKKKYRAIRKKTLGSGCHFCRIPARSEE